MIAFIDDRRDAVGVGPIYHILLIPASTHSKRIARHIDPTRLTAPTQTNPSLNPESASILAGDFAGYSIRNFWQQMMREVFPIARHTSARPTRKLDLARLISENRCARLLAGPHRARSIAVTAGFVHPYRTCYGCQFVPISRSAPSSSTTPSSLRAKPRGPSAGGAAGQLK